MPSSTSSRTRPPSSRESRRYREHGDFSISGLAAAVAATGPLDIVVHSLANGSEVKKPMLETSRKGYLSAVSASAYSMVSMVQHFGPVMRPNGAFVSLTYMASERVIPGYGGGMSSAKAALESDTRTLAFEAGRKWGHRVNAISAGAYASRAASAIGFIDQMVDYAKRNAPLPEAITRARGRHDRGVPVQPTRERHHRRDGVRRQGHARDGHGGRSRGREVRVGNGGRARPSTAPAQPLELWSFEGSPYARRAREVLCELELPYVLHNVGRGSPKRDGLRARAGKVQVPYLEDPNTGTKMFESRDIVRYLRTTYGTA